MQLFSLCSVIVARTYVKTRLRAEKVLSDVADVRGTVRYSLSSWCKHHVFKNGGQNGVLSGGGRCRKYYPVISVSVL